MSLQGHKWKKRADFPTAASKKPKSPTDPCTQWYPGHRAFESPEVNNIANYMTTLSEVKAYIDLRSYGQMSACAVCSTDFVPAERFGVHSIDALRVLVQEDAAGRGRPDRGGAWGGTGDQARAWNAVHGE